MDREKVKELPDFYWIVLKSEEFGGPVDLYKRL